MEFYDANFTKEMVAVDNCAIIGVSQTNPSPDTTNYTNMAAVITPRTGQSNFTNTRFYSYPAGTIAIITCSRCEQKKFFTNTGTEIFFKNLTFSSVDGNYLLMLGLQRDVIYDLDASLSSIFGNENANNPTTSAAIVHNYNHISGYNQQSCRAPAENKWDDAILCDQSVTIRRVFFTNLIELNTFNAQFMKVIPINSFEEVVDPATDPSMFTAVQSRFQNK